MRSTRKPLLILIIATLAPVPLGGSICGPRPLRFLTPLPDQLSLVGDLSVSLRLPQNGNPATLAVELDGSDVTGLLTVNGTLAEGSVPVASEGNHQLVATIFTTAWVQKLTSRSFETVSLLNPDECEVLNDAECLLPYPSSRFQVPAATPTGLQLNIPESGTPLVNGEGGPTDPVHIDPTPYNQLDGFSPTVQILMHFPAGVDVELSSASRLLPPQSGGPPWIDTRTYDGTSLDPNSPTLLIRAATGEQILHFVEPDARADGNPARQALIMRPGESLIPGERYIVAIRGLVDPGGQPVGPEPAFAAVRDSQNTDIPAILDRQSYFEANVFPELAAAGVAREDLILAFDFTVQSEQGLTSQMLSMRDQAFTWLADEVALGHQTFSVSSTEENDCGQGGVTTWRVLRGTFQVPLFLTLDPEWAPLASGFLNVDAQGNPVQNGITQPDFTVSIPCTALDQGGPVPHPVLLGHGLFGLGEDTVLTFAGGMGIDYISGATNWRGLAAPDLDWVAAGIIGGVVGRTSNLYNFPALPDRLRQGMLNTLVLARMMKEGHFNVDPAFQTGSGAASGAFPGPGEEMFYYGASLGGIMGSMFAALSPDLERLNVDVGAMNFSFLLQRSTQFGLGSPSFEDLLRRTGLTDPMETLLGVGLIHELWVRGEPAGYSRHITGDPLPGTNAKKILMTVAWLDKQVSNQASEVLARTLGLVSGEGSVQQALQGIPDSAGAQDSALVVYDTGYFDLFDPSHQPNIPPLANLVPTDVCDPHGVRLTIPASMDQLATFLQPGGQIENFCTGVCDGVGNSEKPTGGAKTCDPSVP
jgi:hypothetical protein